MKSNFCVDKVLTVVVPSFNQGVYLKESLRQLSKYSDRVDIIVLDGGSVDSSIDVIQEYSSHLKYWVSERDDGQAAAINSGLRMAATRWVAFQNSDDFYVDNEFGRLIDFLEISEADVVIAGVGFSDASGKLLIESTAKPVLTSCLSVRNFVHNQSFFIDSKLIERVGLLNDNLRFCLDFDWFVRVMISQPKIDYFRPVVGVQRMHEETKTSTMQDVHDEEFSIIVSKYFSPFEIALGRALFYPYAVFRRVYGFFYKK